MNSQDINADSLLLNDIRKRRMIPESRLFQDPHLDRQPRSDDFSADFMRTRTFMFARSVLQNRKDC